MKMLTLGQTGLSVSELCLGSMTWGTQNTEAEGHAQIDMALDHGVNFIDTAEMYPTNPVSAETVGDTEAIIGSWFERTGRRNDVVLATKIVGEGNAAVRDGAEIDAKTLRSAVEGSLGRLKTDVIDIYQLHWPNRGSYSFRQMWNFDPRPGHKAQILDHMAEVLETAQALIDEGKIRHLAVSNESVWGTAQWLRLAEDRGLPRMVSIQNEYSLLYRQFDTDWAELSVLENVPLLAYSPLATGLLSGKYAGDVTPEGTRRERNPKLGGRVTPYVFEAVAAYLGIAARHGLDPCQMAIAWCLTRPFPVIPLIGATTLAQLKTNLDAVSLKLSDEVMQEIDAAHRAYPAPF